jgi:integrase
VVLLPSAEHHCSAGTVNRKLAAISGLYTFHARHGVDLGDLVTELHPGRRRRSGWKPFLYHLSSGQPERRRTIKLRTPRQHPTILTAGQVQAILDACIHLRDRLLWALLWDTGIRIGEALGLRHEDVAAAEGELTVAPRSNDNRARAKSATPRTIPISPQLIRLYADYLHDEYGDLDSDYVFVNLWGEPFGHPWGYPAVYDLVLRLRRSTGIDFDPHWYRHTYATRLLRQNTPIEVVSTLLGHSSIATTMDIYGHLSVEDARRALEAAGFLTGQEVQW